MLRLLPRALAVVLVSASLAHAAELKLHWPLARSAYQTNELIDLSVVRNTDNSLAAGDLTLKVTGDDGNRLSFTFAVPASTAGATRRTEHLHLNGWLLRPGKYTVEVTCDGATATGQFELYSHIRKSNFRLISWGRAKGADQLVEGDDNLGFNMFYGDDSDANLIRAGVDNMPVCVMSGGHQMDLRMECDWSDPYVVQGGTRRVVRRAFQERTRPNVPGIHFYDEPGLTWHKHPETGEFTPHGVPSQVHAYTSAFGQPPISYHKVDPKNPQDVARWTQWARWKLGFMDAFSKDSQFGVSFVRPDFISATQSQYGFSAFTDGYYFNVVRCLPVTSGHGGYHDFGLGYFNPSFTLEFARARDYDKPCWYLPCWYSNTTADEYRMEQYLSFQTNIQGMICPPDIDPFKPETKPAASAVIETNKLMGRLGTIFTTMPVTRPPVALLYSMSHNIHQQALDRSFNYAHAGKHGTNLHFAYLAGKLKQYQFMPVVDEDIVDGTLAAHHKAVILTSIDYLAPEVVGALESFIADGGLVLTTGDCQAQVKGAVNLGVTPKLPDQEIVNKIMAEKKYTELGPYTTVGKYILGATPLADAIQAKLRAAGIGPVFECDQPGIVATRQASGDVEYLFAVNATYDAKAGGRISTTGTEATIALADDGRPVYDAMRGNVSSAFQKQNGKLVGKFAFGPGQMHVFARTTRPVEGVRVATPAVERSYTLGANPLRVDFSATVAGEKGTLLSGSIPLAIRVTDPQGKVRYALHRATDRGALTLSLPLAVNDTPGKWTVAVRELLSGMEGQAEFTLAPTSTCAALAGATPRAAAFGDDRQNIMRFFRLHKDVTIVKGSSDFNSAAAERFASSLRPWGVRCEIVDATAVNKPRSLSEEESLTWVGLNYAGKGQIKPGDGNRVDQAGFAVRGPIVLLGNPTDNPLIEFLLKEKFLPYTPQKDVYPGTGRGMLAWQRDGIGAAQESITIIAFDGPGMDEAVGSAFEAVAGIEPLTRLELPKANNVATSASK
jgi:hypothetical protein